MEIKLNTKTLLWAVLAVIVIFLIWQTMQISAIGNSAASAVQAAAPSGGGMVGGC